MESGKTDILVGTQMIAKGLDFPGLNLVGLVLADVGFNLPDFRSTEKNFQLITQMSGRSGRHKTGHDGSGEVIVQAFNVAHEALQFAKAHDYLGFVENELSARSPLAYPPFQKLVAIRLQSPDLQLAHAGLQSIKSRASELQRRQSHYQEVQVLGPAAAPLAKLRNQFRFHLLLKAPQAKTLNQFTRQLLGDEKWLPPKVRLIVDVDPVNLL
jgi:primosomal protein N' (replication factor Y) (superfamily II helicase)